MAARRLLAVGAAAAAFVCALPARALASDTQETILLDDNQLIYATPSHMERTLERLASLGVDRVKASVVWWLIAPDPNSKRRPKFDATNPAAYPPGVWDRYDELVRVAGELHLKVYFILQGPVPVWAIPRGENTRQGPKLGHAPTPSAFRQFVEAVGRRYNGSYLTTVPKSEPPPSTVGLPVTVPGLGGSNSSSSSSSVRSSIPRVSFWGIWNEPDERSWLNPYWRTLSGGRTEMLQPSTYRGLVDAAWSGLRASGHSGDTILLGETANRGIWQPLPFIRAMYCLNGSYQLLRGNAAALVGCPTSPSKSKFMASHPGLFQATGWAHHPYGFNVPPNQPYPNSSYVTLYNIGVLEHVLNRIRAAYGQSQGVPLYLTEWGYKTNPPNPFVSTSQTQQAEWLDEGDFMTFQDPYVRSITQFLLVDDKPKPHTQPGSRAYWSTFQTGLVNLNGTPKPSYNTFRVPIWLPRPVHGANVTVWGQLRPANHSTIQFANIEFRATGSHTWIDIDQVQTANPEGYFIMQVPIPTSGQVRIAWRSPSGTTYYSRLNPVH